MKTTVFTQEQLNTIPREVLANMYLTLSSNFEALQSQMAIVQAQSEEQLKIIKQLQESVAVLTQKRFGRSTEKNIIDGQLFINAEGRVIDPSELFNEAESIVKNGMSEEPEYVEVLVKHKKKKGKRAEDISRLEKVIEPTVELPEEDLADLFPNGYKRLDDEVYTDIEYVPAKFIAHEHHYAVYAAKGEGTIIRASASMKPERLFNNSILTPSLMSGIYEMRYALNDPFNRIHDHFERYDANLSKQILASWAIRVADKYLRPMYRYMIRKQQSADLLHCDESPFVLSRASKEDGDGKHSIKAYMWVYHCNANDGSPPIYVYVYEPGRKSDYPYEHLKDYHGILMTDGYQVYHKLEKREPDKFIVAGCWAHARRKFAELVKSAGKEASKGTIPEEAVGRIAAIYHVDNMYKDKSPEERLENRKANVKPLVDGYFTWLKSLEGVDKGSGTNKAINYSLNQETFLRRFLENPVIPLDNNDAERSIRSFCVGKHACHIIDSEAGAESSAMLYSIMETVKANSLKPFEYMKYLLEQMLLHLDDDPTTYIADLAPWSDKLPDECRKKVNS